MAYSSIVKPSVYFNTKLYTGNGTTNTAITGVGFQPDLSIIKARDMTYDHNVMDAVRGSTKRVATNLTDAESTQAEMIKSFASDGFNLGDNGGVNQNTKTYVAWNWKANGAGSSNTDGSITSTVSANTASGFSIVKYTGTGANATVGHGLGAVPRMIIAKRLTDAESWGVYNVSNGTNKYMKLEEAVLAETATSVWNDTAPTSSVFSLGASGLCNGSSKDMIAYCFAEKKGYSKIESYTGNGSTDGPFIYTGFKPAFIFSKKTNASGTSWTIWDNKRSPFNPADKILHPNNTNADNTADDTDFLSNGFKLRATASGMNNNGDSYIYMAFAENPLVANSGTDGVPATAR